jgi:hypothetical protein
MVVKKRYGLDELSAESDSVCELIFCFWFSFPFGKVELGKVRLCEQPKFGCFYYSLFSFGPLSH